MRKFSLKNDHQAIDMAVVGVFKWGALDSEIANQLGFEEQYLKFHRYLLENLESVPAESPHYTPKPIGLSLRAGFVKAYIVFACSIIEGVLANWAKKKGISSKPERLDKKPLGALLKEWCDETDTPRPEVSAIWADLELLLTYRNFLHLNKASSDDKAYWQNILDRESELLRAADTCIEHLASQCSGL